jgi:hypothetical protein
MSPTSYQAAPPRAIDTKLLAPLPQLRQALVPLSAQNFRSCLLELLQMFG